jgi:DnaJ-domain-containing protein 1
MIFLALGAAVLAILVWAGRRPTRLAAPHRIVRALLAALAAAGAVVAGLRGAWIAGLALIALSGWLAAGLSPPLTRAGEMSLDQARSILGVGPRAAPAEIESAYRRLMLRAHPDQGGSDGLAAQLNAARDRLLK